MSQGAFDSPAEARALLERAGALLGALAASNEAREAASQDVIPGQLAGRVHALRSRLERRVLEASRRLAELTGQRRPDPAAVRGLAQRAENIAVQGERYSRAAALVSCSGVDPRAWELEAADVMEAPARTEALLAAAEAPADGRARRLLTRLAALRDEVAALSIRVRDGSIGADEAIPALAASQRALGGLMLELAREILAPRLGMNLPRDITDARWWSSQWLTGASEQLPPSAQAALALVPLRDESPLIGPRALQAWWADQDERWLLWLWRDAHRAGTTATVREEVLAFRGPLAAAAFDALSKRPERSMTRSFAPSTLTADARAARNAEAYAARSEGRGGAAHRARYVAFFVVGSLAFLAALVGPAALPWPLEISVPAGVVLSFGVILPAMFTLQPRLKPPTSPRRQSQAASRRRIRAVRTRLGAVVLDEEGTTLDAVVADLARPGRSAAAPHDVALSEDASLKAVAVRAWRELQRCELEPPAVLRTEAFSRRLTGLERLIDAIERRDEALAAAAEAALAAGQESPGPGEATGAGRES